jgi:hypothetical protein
MVEGDFLYRGVHALHPALADAKRGIVKPGDVHGKLTADDHNAGGVSAISPFTSWTIHFEIAERWAGRYGVGGVILVVPRGPPDPGATWSWELSGDLYFEYEILLRGVRYGVEVWPR